MEVTMTKEVTVYLTFDINELTELRDMLVLVHRDILSKLPNGATFAQEALIKSINEALSEARR